MGVYHHDGTRTAYLREGDRPDGLIHGFGETPEAAVEDFWHHVELEADQARERNAATEPLTSRQLLALQLVDDQVP